MTKEKDIEKEYFHQLRNILTKSSLYLGDKIERIDVVNMIHFKKSNFNIIDKYIAENAYSFLVNFSFNSQEEGLELLEVLLIKDIYNNLYIVYMIDNSELFSDKHIYNIRQLKSEEYEGLVNSENHKGFYVYTD